MKLYYHKTIGGAEYLCSSSVEGTNEGSFDSKYIIRIDGNIKKDAELNIENDESFEVINISREDLEELGYKTDKVTDEQMESIAKMVRDGISESGAFDDALEAAAEEENLVEKQK